jgi:hypothetical protein
MLKKVNNLKANSFFERLTTTLVIIDQNPYILGYGDAGCCGPISVVLMWRSGLAREVL